MNNDRVIESPDGRRAVAYEDAQRPGVWLVRFEKYPEHHQGGAWYGGRVNVALTFPSADAAEKVARYWVDDEEVPWSL